MKQETNEQQKFKMMTEAPVERLVCRMAVPTIITMLISAFYNMADTFFVGKLGTSATAAVGVVFSLMAIVQAVSFFFGNGSGNYMSRKLGEQKTEEAVTMASTAFFTSLLVGVLFTVLGFLFVNPLARFLGSTETILPYAVSYLKCILLGIPFIMGSFVLNNQLRFQGSAFYGMLGMVTGAVLNIVLDPICIFVFDMGIAGAAFATMLSQIVSFFILLAGCKKGGNVRIRLANVKPGLSLYREITKGGFPSLIRQGMASVATICLNQIAGLYGDTAIAAMSVVSRISMFAGSALIGFGQGFQPVCGFNYGAKLYKRVERAYWFCIKISTVALAVIAAVGYILAPQLIAIFRKDDLEVIEIGAAALRMQCFTLPLNGLIILSNMLLQTIGKSLKASILAMGRQFLFFLPVLFILTPLLGLLGIQICQPIADVLTFALAVPLTGSVLKEMRSERYVE